MSGWCINDVRHSDVNWRRRVSDDAVGGKKHTRSFITQPQRSVAQADAAVRSMS
jgi:hypothetical protein